MTPQLTSMQNPKVKGAIKLRSRRERDRAGLFLIEGYRELFRAIAAGQPIETLFYCPALFLGSNEPALIEQVTNGGTITFSCSEALFQKLSYRDRPDGLLAVAPQHSKGLEQLQVGDTPLLLVAEAIEKPGNLGTILRCADAVGVDGVIVCDRCTDIYNPNVVRASIGTLFTIPVIEATSIETIAWLKERQIAIVAATPTAQQSFIQAPLSGPLAIAVGTEQLGLTELWLREASITVNIPMNGAADSLNVAIAAALLLYESLRQRG